MPWFTYNQNNSGGDFVFDAEKGISHFVIVEAKNDQEADSRAIGIGLYFDGCASGFDCDCCGDRWSSAYEGAGTTKPTIYGKPVAKYGSWILWMKPNPEIFVHPLRGKFKAIQGKLENLKSDKPTKKKVKK